MDCLDAEDQAVGRHYDATIFEYETERLSTHTPVECAITLRYLERYIEPSAIVAEVGVGAGLYSEFLARRGCRLHLIDVSQRLLRVAQERLRASSLNDCILDVRRASATGLTHVATGGCDVVLLLGPLYYLRSPENRQGAVAEATRVLKPGGLLYAAGINRLAFLRDAFHARPNYTFEQRSFHLEFLRDGNLDPQHAPPLGYAHLTTSTELRALFAGTFSEVAFVGVESFAGNSQHVLTSMSGDSATAWLDLIEQTGRTVDGVGMSDHFLYVGRRR